MENFQIEIEQFLKTLTDRSFTPNLKHEHVAATQDMIDSPATDQAEVGVELSLKTRMSTNPPHSQSEQPQPELSCAPEQEYISKIK